MALLVSHALEQMRFELGGGDVPSELGSLSILNQAGHHLHSMHAWRWTVGRAGLLNLRGVLSGSTATWTAATNTLTQSGAWTNYSFLAGDEIRITDGTGATTGVYVISSRTSANAIVLEGSIASGNLATGDIQWRLDPQTIALPTDLRDIIAIQSTSLSAVGGVSLTTMGQILEMRKASASITASTGLFYGAVVFSGSPPVPILEIYPSPSDNATGAMRIFYRSRWTNVTNDTSSIDIPDFVQDLFILIARAYAGGYVRNDQASLSARLAEIAVSPVFMAAKKSDGMTQPFMGQLRNGGAQIWRRGTTPTPTLANQVAPPSI